MLMAVDTVYLSIVIARWQ